MRPLATGGAAVQPVWAQWAVLGTGPAPRPGQTEAQAVGSLVLGVRTASPGLGEGEWGSDSGRDACSPPRTLPPGPPPGPTGLLARWVPSGVDISAHLARVCSPLALACPQPPLCPTGERLLGAAAPPSRALLIAGALRPPPPHLQSRLSFCQQPGEGQTDMRSRSLPASSLVLTHLPHALPLQPRIRGSWPGFRALPTFPTPVCRGCVCVCVSGVALRCLCQCVEGVTGERCPLPRRRRAVSVCRCVCVSGAGGQLGHTQAPRCGARAGERAVRAGWYGSCLEGAAGRRRSLGTRWGPRPSADIRSVPGPGPRGGRRRPGPGVAR